MAMDQACSNWIGQDWNFSYTTPSFLVEYDLRAILKAKKDQKLLGSAPDTVKGQGTRIPQCLFEGGGGRKRNLLPKYNPTRFSPFIKLLAVFFCQDPIHPPVQFLSAVLLPVEKFHLIYDLPRKSDLNLFRF